MKKANFLVFTFLFFYQLGYAQDSIQQKRLKPLLIGSGIAYTGALIGLNKLWYSDFERESFHFFDDHSEWKQMDKIGHFYSAFHLSKGGHAMLNWAGMRKDKALFWGSMFSIFVLTPIEIFDGFSAEYGASYSDMIANVGGTTFFYLQQKKWDEIRIHPKFSFQRSGYAPLRPQLLGDGFHEEILKDYNGQTYWLSFDLSRFIKTPFPKWLNVAVGYSADNMLSADDSQNHAMGFHPKRQYLLSLDIDLSEYQSKSKLLNTFLFLINMIHLPAPAIEYNGELNLHFIYY